MQFKQFSVAVAKQFQSMIPTGLFRVGVEKENLWNTYLGSFPDGSNPLYVKRTEHDCSACRGFVRAIGGAVTIVDGKLVSIWDINIGGEYQVVADAMSALVKAKTIDNVFIHAEKTVGIACNRQLLEDKSVKTWDHFFVNLPAEAFAKGTDIGPKLSEFHSTHDVMLRSLQEITVESVYIVLDLIAQNSLYRGEEQKFAVETFRVLKIRFCCVAPEFYDAFVWERVKSTPQSVSRIRNTAIGTLLVDLSEGKEIDEAVKSFEVKVAPANYKRPTALITKRMIADAQAKIVELGLASALERRYATIDDITINNLLFADRSAKKSMNVFDDLASRIPENRKAMDRVEEVPAEKFFAEVLPKADSLEVMFENRNAGNLVSLIAACDPTAKPLFKWPNQFSWSYTGEVTDSIKERVKAAGGSVVGDLCCRLAWDYTDDLDFHMMEPGGGHIYYQNRRQLSTSGGMLDVDANGGDGIRANPVENIFYSNRRTMCDGGYTLAVNNYQRRSSGTGFEVEIEFDGKTHSIVYEKALPTGQTIEVAQIKYSKTSGFEIIKSLPSTQTSKTVWSVPTQVFHKVKVVMLSPNHWDDRAVGNKHYFFMLDGCRNEGTARGFFNEFLTEDLAKYRKVFEVVGAKMKTEESDRQLSGLGFSSTQRNQLLVRVNGSLARTIKVLF